MKKQISLLFLLFNFLFASEYTVGSGKLEIKSEVLPQIITINSDSNIDINIYKSDKNYYQLSGDNNIIDLIEIKVNKEKLYLKTKKSFSTKNKIVLNLFLQTIKEIDLRGSSNLSLNSLDEQKLYLDIDGSISVNSKFSQTKLLVLKVDGSYEIDLKGLKTKKADISLAGSGNLALNVENDLKIVSDAVANVTYIGNPTIKKELNFMTNLESEI